MNTHYYFLKFLVPLCLFTLILIVAGYFAQMDPDWHHDGILFKPAVDVASGLSLFRETFTQYGALTTYLQAIAIKLFGKHLIVLRYEAVLFLSLSGVLLFLLFRRIVPDLVASLSVLVWLFMAPYFVVTFLPWSSIYSLFFMTLGAFFLLQTDGSQSQEAECWYCFCSGLSFAACFWARQPTGILFVVLSGFFLLSVFNADTRFARTIYRALSYLAGFIILNTIAFGWLLADGSLFDWWKQSIVGASSFAEEAAETISISTIFHHLFPRAQSIFGGNGSVVWLALPIINLLVLAVTSSTLVFKRRQSRKHHALLIVSLLGLGSWHQYFPRLSIFQCYWAATPMIGVAISAAYLLVRSIKLNHAISVFATLVFIVILFGNDIYYRLSKGASIYPVTSTNFPTLKGMRLSNQFPRKNNFDKGSVEYFSDLEKLGETLIKVTKIDPNISMLTFTSDAYLPTVFASRNGHKITVWWYWAIHTYPDHKERIKKFIQAERPLIEIKVKPWGWFRYDWANRNSPIRIEYGFEDYDVLIGTEYSDSGSAQILAPPEVLAKYRSLYGDT